MKAVLWFLRELRWSHLGGAWRLGTDGAALWKAGPMGRLRVGWTVAVVGWALGLWVVRSLWLRPPVIASDQLSLILDQQQQNWESELARLERAKRETAGALAMRSIVASLRSDLAEARRRDQKVAP